MVVLEGGGGVVTIGNNQYLQPDYLSPLPNTMDSKKSPLALLAQTCSQIGADSSAVKPILSMDKKNKNGNHNDSSSSSSSSSSSTSKSPSQVKTPKSSTPQASTEIKLAFKPYEANVLNHQHMTKSEDHSFANSQQNQHQHQHQQQQQQRPSSKSSSSSDCGGGGGGRVPSRNKSNCSPEISVTRSVADEQHNNGGKTTPNGDNRKTVSPSGSSQRGASPIVRSGMEVLHGHPQAYKTSSGPYGPLNPLSALCCPPGMEQHANPAFRPSFGGGYAAHHHAAMLAAAAANGYPGGQGNPNPYISYQRIKTPAGGEAIVPVCKDPYCPGCPYSQHTQQMLMGAPCPSGCTQCEHQKYGLAMAASMAGSLPPGHPYSAAAAAAAASAAQMRTSPYVCSWIAGDSYCGKRFNTSDDLFSHLRTHTGNLSDPAAAAAALAQSQTQSLLSSLFPPSALQRGYSNAPLSPMSAAAAAAAAARYHPYAKPGSMQSPFGGGGGFNPAAAAAALGPYYSPYAMYGQRIGSAAVHQ